MWRALSTYDASEPPRRKHCNLILHQTSVLTLGVYVIFVFVTVVWIFIKENKALGNTKA